MALVYFLYCKLVNCFSDWRC